MKTDTNNLKTMKTKRIDSCRYYKGEETCPQSLEDQQKGIAWFYEMKWVTLDDSTIEDLLEEYEEMEMLDFSSDDGTPLSLKALFLNRYYHQDGDIPDGAIEFKKWYKTTYLKTK